LASASVVSLKIYILSPSLVRLANLGTQQTGEFGKFGGFWQLW